MFTTDVSTYQLWVSGTISTSRIENDVALAAYKMEMEFSEIYKEEG